MARNFRQAVGSLILLGLCTATTATLLLQPAAVAGAATGTTTSPGAGTGWTETEPTSAELRQQQAQVARLRAEAERRAAQVDDAQQALQGAAVLAGQALEAYAGAVTDLQARQQAERQQQDRLVAAQRSLDTSRSELGRWARQAYQGGSGLGSSAAVTTLLQTDAPEDLGSNLTVLRRIGRDRNQALADMVTARREADVAADAAATASELAGTAAVAAEAAKTASEAAVNDQRRLLGIAESSLAASTEQVSDAAARAAGLRAALLVQAQAQQQAREQAQAKAAALAAGAGSSLDNKVTGQVGSCTGGAVEQYGNGQIPTAALCSLLVTPRHYLRADAAYAFDRLGQAYAKRFGAGICVTDSYRSYAAQVSVYARKPGLAAVPGTSNHGWGRAVDLCGGIQSFSSEQYRWMSENAPLYGWFHPGWAQQSGSKPEPWHWEFAG